MPASSTFTVALVLTAVNHMTGALTQGQNNLKQYSDQVRQAASEVGRYDQRINDLEKSMQKYGQIRQQGLKDIQAGLIMAAPVEEAVRQAAKFEGVMTKVENALYDSSLPAAELQKQMGALTQQALDLGAVTVFSNMEAAEAQLTLIKNGMEFQDVLQGGATAAMYLAQTAEVAPAAAADAVSQITNMFQLQGNQLLKVADDVNRAANASSAGVGNIMQALQQTGMTAHTLGLNVKETTLLLGTLYNLGLGEGSGTYLNDMLINLDKVTPKARKALQAMGWLEGATVKTMKSGQVKIIGGTNSLFDEAGQIRSAQALVDKLRQVLYNNPGLKPEEMRDKAGNLLPQEEIERLLEAKNKLTALQQLKDVFGIQGMRAAIALATPGKGSYEEMVAKAERAKAIQDQVLQWQETLLGKLETLKGSWETLMTQSGTPLTNEVGGMVNQVTNMVNATGNWANANPKLASSLLKVLGYAAGFKIILGGGKLLFGGFGGAISWTGGMLLRATRYAHGFFDTYKYFRQGAGVFRSLWSAVSFGGPTITRVMTTVGRFGGRLVTLGLQALLTGARLAAAWLIGLGPVGWIILGVTALIAGAVAAWKTNFMGFRDLVMRVYEKILPIINKVRTFLGMPAIEMAAEVEKKVTAPQEKPPLIRASNPVSDNRKYNFNITSTDPKGAAQEVSKILGGPGMDKYKLSRDPRLQTDFAFGQ